MDEFDNIIIDNLREIGCDVGEEIKNLSNFNPELLVKVVTKCVQVIDPTLIHNHNSFNFPTKMPSRVNVCSMLALKVQELQYNGTVGYQTFLYPSEPELRRLFLFLIDKFPKEDKLEKQDGLDQITQTKKSAAESLSTNITEPWLSPYYNSHKLKGQSKAPYNSIGLDAPLKMIQNEDNQHYENSQKSVSEQVHYIDNFLPSILSYNANLLHSLPTNIIDRLEWISANEKSASTTLDYSSVLTSTLCDILTSKVDKDEQPCEIEAKMPEETLLQEKQIDEPEQNIAAKIEDITNECEKLRLSVEQEQLVIEKLYAKLSQVIQVQQSEQQELSVLEEQKKMIARSYDLLDNGETNIKKLEAVIETKRNKLLGLAMEWEDTRKPLIQKYRDQNKNNSTKSKIEKIRVFKEKQRELNQEIRNKEQQYSQLVNVIKNVSKDSNRSAYTRRIYEIINNIKKQKDEIEKVTDDTRNIKKDINTLTGRLERSYAVVEGLCRQDNAHRLLIDLHSSFNSLINHVEETGTIIREIRDLEEQIDDESVKNVEASLARVTADLIQMEEENTALKAQLEKLDRINDS